MSSNCICIAVPYAPALADEDAELDPDRWCSHSAWGQEAWQIVSQWVWNLRLEVGHQLQPESVRTTEFAPALPPPSAIPSHTVPPSGYAFPQVGLPWKTGRFSGQDFALQPDGTLRCPADQKLHPHEQRVIRRWESARRVRSQSSQLSSLCAARAMSMEWERHRKAAPGERPPASLTGWFCPGAASQDWSRRAHRRACRQLVRHLHIEVSQPAPAATSPPTAGVILSRAQRAHFRLSWQERLAHNARTLASSQVTIKLFGIPESFAASPGLATA